MCLLSIRRCSLENLQIKLFANFYVRLFALLLLNFKYPFIFGRLNYFWIYNLYKTLYPIFQLFWQWPLKYKDFLCRWSSVDQFLALLMFLVLNTGSHYLFQGNGDLQQFSQNYLCTFNSNYVFSHWTNYCI